MARRRRRRVSNRKPRKTHMRAGVRCVKIKKVGWRRVKVLKSGKWRFVKGKCRK